MTNQDTAPRAPGVSRRAFAAGLTAVPAAGLITAVPLNAAASDDGPILRAFEAYTEAVKDLNASPLPIENDPLADVHGEAFDAMERTPDPTTLAGAIVKLRFALATTECDGKLIDAILHGTPQDRVRMFRTHRDRFTNETGEHIAGAIVALEAIQRRGHEHG